VKRDLRPTRRPQITGDSTAGQAPVLQPRERFVLAGVIGGGAAVGASLADIMAAVARVDRDLTEAEARQILGGLLAYRYIEISGVDRDRYVATRKAIQELER
jgi:hypothetical protein